MSKTITRLLMEKELKSVGESSRDSGNWGNVLDVGSPDKKYNCLFRHRTWTNLDLSDKADITANIENWQSNKQYDILLCTCLLEHLRNPNKALKNIHYALKEGGKLILTVPFYYHIHDSQYGDYRRWTPQGIKAELELAGFKEIEVRVLGNVFTALWQTFCWHNLPPLSWINKTVFWTLGFNSQNSLMNNGTLTVATK